MDAYFKDIYIGKLIQQKVEERHLTYSEFARMIHCSRTSLYSIFNSKSIDTERLLHISKVLGYDFINEVYLKHTQDTNTLESPHIILPIRNRDIDISELPPELLRLIKEKIGEMNV
ncbi:MAG: helix-turn-helix transcriptional regulator [Bacteroidaceae bacterium]|nr:helix-turn-helix transcriptional regulator [Bacteroidaceae bacterium]